MPLTPIVEPASTIRIFVSTDHAEDPLSMALLARLRHEAWSVDQSPKNPDDPRWPEWYSAGCTRAIAAADVVITVATPGWDGSTWMCHEASVALRLPRPLFLWNPAARRVPLGMLPYAEHPLPADLEQVIAVLAAVKPVPTADIDALPPADPGREQQAREMFPLTMSPDEYAARHAHEWFCFSFDDYRYSDPALHLWIQRLGDILFRRNAAPSLEELRARYLSVEERSGIAPDESESGDF